MTAQRIGYARASTWVQNLDLQREMLEAASCHRVYEDIISGTQTQPPGLAQALAALREGDTLVVWKLDRLGRGVKGLLYLTASLNARGIGFVSLTDAIDTTISPGCSFFKVMDSLERMERELIVERTQSGVQAAREKGRATGRKPVMTEAMIRTARELLSQGTSPREVANSLGIAVATLYRWVPATNTAEASAP